MEPEAIMKGGYDTFMLKEINEQPSSLRMTMAGRVQEGSMKVTLGGIEGYIGKIREGRRLLILACGTSYISAVATRQFMEDHTRLPVTIDLASDFLDRSPYVSR